MNQNLLKSLIGKEININRKGPKSKTGTLLNAADDFLVILINEGKVVYYQNLHIKSITENTKKSSSGSDLPQAYEYKLDENFKGLLESSICQWVSINDDRPDKVEGVLHSCHDDYISVIYNEEIIHLSIHHVRNISYSLNGDNSDKKKEQDSQKGTENKAKISEQELENKQTSKKEGNTAQKKGNTEETKKEQITNMSSNQQTNSSTDANHYSVFGSNKHISIGVFSRRGLSQKKGSFR